MEKINVLIFPCGSEIAFEIHNALKYNVNFNVFGGSSIEDQCKSIFRNYVGELPYIQEESFVPRLNQLIEKYKIGMIFPTHDTVALTLAENRSKIKTRLAVPDLETARICRNKRLTYELFRNFAFNPIVYQHGEEIEFPVFLKPNIGQGGKKTRLIQNAHELQGIQTGEEDNLLVEYLPGEELTVDCFTDRHGALRFIGPRSRETIFGGISVHTRRVPPTPEIEMMAGEINHALKLRGLWFFQVKKDKRGNFKLLEVSVRASSSMSVYRMLGVNFPLITAYDLLDLDVEIMMNDTSVDLYRSFLNKYDLNLEYDKVYIDFDDTITRNEEVNEFVMLFIYQQVRKNKKLILVTRHEFDIHQTLQKLRIDAALFDRIITLTTEQSKADFIKDPEMSIFIDNAYNDRREVKHKWNMPVFDVDAVAGLVDWRE